MFEYFLGNMFSVAAAWREKSSAGQSIEQSVPVKVICDTLHAIE